MKKATNVETETLVDSAQLVSEYAFGKLKNKPHQMGPIARHAHDPKAEWVD